MVVQDSDWQLIVSGEKEQHLRVQYRYCGCVSQALLLVARTCPDTRLRWASIPILLQAYNDGDDEDEDCESEEDLDEDSDEESENEDESDRTQ